MQKRRVRLRLASRGVYLSLGLICLALLIQFEPTSAVAQRLEPGGAPPPGSGPKDVRGFVRVIDGDTIEARIDGKRVGIRLLGHDSPPLKTDCGRRAADRLRALVQGGVHLDEDPVHAFNDRKLRLYHAKTRDGRSISESLIGDGLAVEDGRGEEPDRLASAEARGVAANGCAWRQPRRGASIGDDGLFAAVDLNALATASDVKGEPAAATARAVAAAPASLPNELTEEIVTGGFGEPTGFAFLPDGRILITEKRGVVKVFKNGNLLSTPFIDIADHVNDYWDRGLLGIAVDPQFPSNGYVYLLYTYENDQDCRAGLSSCDEDAAKTSRLTRVTASGDIASGETVILGSVVGDRQNRSCKNFAVGTDCLPADDWSHSIGSLRFAADGTLFVTNGDASSFNVVDDDALRAQDLDSLAGKVLRINTSGQGVAGNPFYSSGGPTSIRSKIWAYGVRNGFRMGIKPGGTTGTPYVGDVGWNNWEEINVGIAGANFGWPCYEGNFQQGGYASKPTCSALYAQTPSPHRAPLVTYEHNGQSASITGGAFYTGTGFPSQYSEAFFYADYSQNWIKYVKTDSSHALSTGPSDFATSAWGPVDFAVGSDGNLYYLVINAKQLRRIKPSSSGAVTCPTDQFKAEYFNNLTLSGSPTLIRCEGSVNYDWGATNPASGIAPDNFSVRWTGQHNFGSGPYRFTATADDGIRVYLDGTAIIDAWIDQSATTYTRSRTVTAGEHAVRVEYYDSGWEAVAQVAWQAETANTPPVPTISPPTGSTLFAVGDVIQFSGTATDAQDGALPSGSLAWTVNLHHCPGVDCHVHPFTSAVTPVPYGGSFAVPDHGDGSYFEIVLTATDSGGLTGTTSVSIQPQLAPITLATSPTGLQVVFNGTTGAAPLTRNVVAKSTFTIYTPSPQGASTFSSWSDGGAQSHNVTAGVAAGTFTATFTTAAAPPPPPPTDTTAPTVTAVTPAAGATGVATSVSPTATFSEDVMASTVTTSTFTLVRQGSTTALSANVSYNATTRTASLDPSGVLEAGVQYTARVKGGASGVTDTAGNALATDKVWTFTLLAASQTCPTGQFLAQYWNNTALSGSPVLARCEAAVNYEWGVASPAPGVVNADNFSVRWAGRHSFQQGAHTFVATTDDGMRVFVDGTRIINAWKDQPPSVYRKSRSMTTGVHDIVVEFYERGGGATAKLAWVVGAAGSTAGEESGPIPDRDYLDEGELLPSAVPTATILPRPAPIPRRP